ncbi:pentapeptide repeat-containing protein [Amycolatopsis vastitatis]|uniref:pentapeptide repeat-containing protein n=1 Tax=Amycolatopsis vastitatis TaxID=1905142 RepID=UPI001F0B04B4|nr:pentapeptide repeat-containing protein [Amycolatopsis vastitatis]
MKILGEPDDRCRGVQIDGFDRCLAHLDPTELNTFLSGLFPGADLDVRGTAFDSQLLRQLMQAVTTHSSSPPRAELRRSDFRGATFAQGAGFGRANFAEGADFRGATFTQGGYFGGATFAEGAYFSGATFTQDAYFSGATFTKYTSFKDATFAQDSYFDHATFTKNISFSGATFTEDASFSGATFTKNADFEAATFTEGGYFNGATFTKTAFFRGATFTEDAYFNDATFTEGAYFGEATFTKKVSFSGATFSRCERLGPLTAEQLDVCGTQFGVAVVVEAEAGEVSCQRARFSGGVELRVRHGRVDLAEVLFGAASSLGPSASARATEAKVKSWREKNNAIDHRPVLTSLRGTDVSELALTDVDLRWCRFAGAHHLDKLRIEGDSPFPQPPRRVRALGRPRRQVIFEEHPWRAQRMPKSGWLASGPFDTEQVEQVGPGRLAALYRSLRKALEDGKNEAGAGDFYFGEQEARRRAVGTSFVERAVLWAYWLISGYGQRASRAITALVGIVAVLAVVLITCGLPVAGPTSQSTTVTRAVPGGGQETVTTSRDVAPQLPPGDARWTLDRVDTSVRIALGAVAFRDAGQKLTSVGTWAVMVARFVGPILLALAALAVRARVKR